MEFSWISNVRRSLFQLAVVSSVWPGLLPPARATEPNGMPFINWFCAQCQPPPLKLTVVEHHKQSGRLIHRSNFVVFHVFNRFFWPKIIGSSFGPSLLCFTYVFVWVLASVSTVCHAFCPFPSRVKSCSDAIKDDILVTLMCDFCPTKLVISFIYECSLRRLLLFFNYL